MEVTKRLYYGHVNDIGMNVVANPEYKSIQEMRQSHMDYLRRKFPTEARDRLDELEDLQSQECGVNDYECFYCGFRDGIKLMIEVLYGDGKFVRKENKLQNPLPIPEDTDDEEYD